MTFHVTLGTFWVPSEPRFHTCTAGLSSPQTGLSAWCPSCNTQTSRQVAVLGQQKALSWAGFPSSPRGSPPRLPEGAGGAGHTRRQGLATRAGATQGPTAPPPAVVRAERYVFRGGGRDKSAYTATSAGCLFPPDLESPGDCVELSWHCEDRTREEIGM